MWGMQVLQEHSPAGCSHHPWRSHCIGRYANAEDRCSGGFEARFGHPSIHPFNRVGVQLCAMNVYGRENASGYEWDERRGVNIIEGLDEALPTIGLRFEYSWTPGE
jgi:hypothetical protein